jgi:FMN-dependent NADH-azoreductase
LTEHQKQRESASIHRELASALSGDTGAFQTFPSQLPDYTDHSTRSEADSLSSSQEILRFLKEPDVYLIFLPMTSQNRLPVIYMWKIELIY